MHRSKYDDKEIDSDLSLQNWPTEGLVSDCCRTIRFKSLISQSIC